MSKIVFFEVCEKEKEICEPFFKDLEISFINEKLNKENINLAQDAEIISIFVNSEVNKEIIDLLPNLKFITTRSTGYDHIDIHSKSQRNKLQFITNNQTDVGLIQETNIILLLSHQYFPRKCFPYNFFGNNTEQEMNLQYFQSHYFPNASTTNLFIMNHTTTTSSSLKSFILHCTSFTGSAEKKIYFFRKLGLWKLDKFKYS